MREGGEGERERGRHTQRDSDRLRETQSKREICTHTQTEVRLKLGKIEKKTLSTTLGKFIEQHSTPNPPLLKTPLPPSPSTAPT